MSGDRHHAVKASLAEYDGRTTSDLEAIASQWRGDVGYLDALIDLAGSDEGQIGVGATWLLKQALEEGERLAPTQVERLIGKLPLDADWAAQLHLAQSLRWLEVPEEQAGAVAEWLTPLLVHKRPFLRAWALDGLAHLARLYSAYGAGFETALDKALEDDAASVRARARRLASGG